MPETGENVAERFRVSRTDQDAFALRSQQRALSAQASRRLAAEDRSQRHYPPGVARRGH